MDNLTSYISNKRSKYKAGSTQGCIDGHIHLFDKYEFLGNLYAINKMCVGFGDYSIRHIDEYKGHMKDYYDQFIEKFYDPSHHVLLACAPTIEEAIEIYEHHPEIIKGFGEIKVHKLYEGQDYNTVSINGLRKLCKYSSNHNNLPIYIHYTLSGDKYLKHLENTLKSYPSVPIVLCHCGMDEECNCDDIYYRVLKLQHIYSNLWVDISFTASEYFKRSPMKLYNMCLDRCILGSDLNPQIFQSENIKSPKKFCDNCYIDYDTITKYISTNSDSNVRKLFRI